MRRFELIEGTSSKFWEIEVTDTDLAVTFGRIGTAGQSRTKTFASNAAALTEEAKLIKEKTGKGYREVGASTRAEKPAPRREPVAQSASEPRPEETDTATQSEELSATPTELDWPQGGFAWSDEWRAELPVVRGIHILPANLPGRGVAMPPSFADDKWGSASRGWSELQQAGAALEGGLWTEAEAVERVSLEHLQQKDMDAWRQLFYQCAARNRYASQEHLNWAGERAMVLHGLPFALDTLLSCGTAIPARIDPWYGPQRTLYGALRRFVAAADEADYLACRDLADAWRGRHMELDHVVSYLFPEMSDWAEVCVDRKLPERWAFWLDDCTMSVDAACRHVRPRAISPAYAVPKALLLIHLYGEAALPFLELLLDKATGKDDALPALRVILQLRTPGAIPALVTRLENREVRATLDRLTEHWPAAILKCAVERTHASRSRTVESWAVRLALRLPAAVAPALAACGNAERQYFSALLDHVATPDEAPAEVLPEILRTPPWTRARNTQVVPVVPVTVHTLDDEMLWKDEEMKAAQRQAAQYASRADLRPFPVGQILEETRQQLKRTMPTASEQQILIELKKLVPEQLGIQGESILLHKAQRILDYLQISRTAHGKVLAGETLRTEDITVRQYSHISPLLLFKLPAPAALAVWNGMPPKNWSAWGLKDETAALLSSHGLRALPGLVNLATTDPEAAFGAAQPCRSGRLAPAAAHALKNTKKAKLHAMAWLRRHPETAIEALIPDALGKDRVPRENAQFCLRWLAQEGHEARLREIAAGYGNEAAVAVECMLGVDPTLVVPARMPKLPTFFVPAAFRRPVLKTGGALPLEAAGFVGNMLSISSLDVPYGGLEVVKRACTPDSLGEFVWDLFEAWLSAGAPSKEAWAFQALGLLGDDETARRLAPKIREWPGESAHARAVVGLDILAAIGSDVALMHLNAIAAKVKFKGLQEKAREKIAQVAEARDLTPEELADRLVPDLGLDQNGTLELNFGPRRFFVSFDETLKPFVKDEGGARLKDLPKPNKSDDEALATEAVERYKAIKKDAKSIASMQLIRLEQCMCGRRQWSPENFRLFFLEHPLMRHLSRRLVWGTYRDGKLAHAFRVAEDLTLADASDDLFELPPDVEVGVAHVLELPAELARDFGQVFADYEILQPFRQLGRETYAPSEEEKRDKAITRFKDKTVATGSIMGLTNRGWERGDAQDGGWVGWFTKRLPGGLEANLEMDPGTVVGDMSYEPKQRIPSIEIRRQGSWDDAGKVDLATVDPIVVSELIRDADLLAPFSE